MTRGRAAAFALAGALTIAWSAVLVRQASVEPATAALYRCAYALPALGGLAWWERRRFGPLGRRQRALAALSGAFFAADLIFWHEAIEAVGAGLSTVLANVQVVVVPLLAWLFLREAPGARIAAILPIVMTGVLLISGVLEDGAYGDDPVGGAIFGILTGLTYAAFLLLLRSANADLRRPAGPLLDATASSAVLCLAVALIMGVDDLAPAWPSAAWLVLLALSSQVLGWMLISTSLPRLPAALTSVILTVQPLGSLLLGAVLFAEAPTELQLAGAALIVAGLVGLALSQGERRSSRQPSPSRT